MRLKHFNFYGFIILYGIIFLIILYKVFHVPVTTDEVPTVFFYSKFNVWKIMMFPDNWPNNHILNTLFVKLSILLFGNEQWVIRLPNLLFFILYGFGIFRILKIILKQDSFFFLPGALLFVNPYLLDFFGLCRGYGISTTLVIISVWLILEGFAKKKDSLIWFSILASSLAAYANFTVLVFWASSVLIAWFYFFTGYNRKLKALIKPTLLIFLSSVVFLAIIAVPIMKMQETDQFKYWSSEGFYRVTFMTMIYDWQYDSKILSKIHYDVFKGIFEIIFLINIYYLIFLFKSNKFTWEKLRQPVVLAFLILLLPVFINLLQILILNTPNLRGRTALFFFPLFSTFTVIVLSQLQTINRPGLIKTSAILIGIIFVLNLTHRTSLKSVREWNYDKNTLEVTNYLKDKYNGVPVTLSTNWIFHPSFYFYSYTDKIPFIELQPYDYNLDVNTSSDYYYVLAEDYKYLEPRFEVAYKFSSDRWLLKQRK